MENASKKFYICHFSSWCLKGRVISWNSLVIFKTEQHSYCVQPLFSRSMCEMAKALLWCWLALASQSTTQSMSSVVLFINLLEV